MKVFELLSACKTNMRNLTFAASMSTLLSNEDAILEVFRAVYSAIKEVNTSFEGVVSFATVRSSFVNIPKRVLRYKKFSAARFRLSCIKDFPTVLIIIGYMPKGL